MKDGRLKFGEKPKTMKIDSNPLHVANTDYVDPFEVLMMEATEGLIDEQVDTINSLATLTLKATDGIEDELVVATAVEAT